VTDEIAGAVGKKVQAWPLPTPKHRNCRCRLTRISRRSKNQWQYLR
jgi:hypothetical protein